jgi:GNAT superfamily N-acetyltransferase
VGSTAEPEPRLRLATGDDRDAIDALMKASIRDLFPAYYDERQTASSVEHVGHVDPTLIEDDTYFVIETRGDIVACGGWSKRDKLFSGASEQEGRSRLLDPTTEPAHVRAMFVRGDWTRRGLGTRILEACESAARAEGFTRLSLMATLPGYQLYVRYGFVEDGRGPITLADGVTVEAVSMAMDLEDQVHPRRNGRPVNRSAPS